MCRFIAFFPQPHAMRQNLHAAMKNHQISNKTVTTHYHHTTPSARAEFS